MGDAPSSYPHVITVDDGDYITLEAVPASGYQFTEWDGPSSGLRDDNPLRMQIVRTTNITANFAPDFSQFSSADGKLDLVINDGTTALDGAGGPLTNVDFVVIDNPPAANGASIIGRAYDLQPDGATFNPGATLRWDYETAYIPEGVEPTDLIIAYHDGATGQWVPLNSTIDLNDAVIETTIQHLTTFAILAPTTAPVITEPTSTFTTSNLSIAPTEVNPGGEVNISVLLTNTGQESASSIVALKIDGAIEGTQQVTLTGGDSQVVTFTTTREAAGTYQVDVNGLSGYVFSVTEGEVPLPPPTPQIEPPAPEPEAAPAAETELPFSGVNWAIAIPIMVAVFLAIFLPIRLRRREDSLDW